MSMRKQEQKVYKFILDYIHSHHIPPTLREIAEGCYISPGVARRCIDVLEARGLITREEGRRRSIALVEDDPDHR